MFQQVSFNFDFTNKKSYLRCSKDSNNCTQRVIIRRSPEHFNFSFKSLFLCDPSLYVFQTQHNLWQVAQTQEKLTLFFKSIFRSNDKRYNMDNDNNYDICGVNLIIISIILIIIALVSEWVPWSRWWGLSRDWTWDQPDSHGGWI